MPAECDTYWASRMDHALGSAIKAQSQRTRLAYLELARHYALMQAFAEGRAGKAGECCAQTLEIGGEPQLTDAAGATLLRDAA